MSERVLKMTIKRDVQPSWRPATRMVHGGQLRSQYKETAEAIYMTSGYVYGSAEEAEAAFDNSQPRFVYSRFGNPTVAMFEERMALLEGAEAARATASGMAAVFAALACQVKAGRSHRLLRRLVRLLPIHPWRRSSPNGASPLNSSTPAISRPGSALSKPTKAVFLNRRPIPACGWLT